MGSGGERTRTSSHGILPPRLVLSAALAALIVAAPAGDRTSALAMNLRGFGAARFGGPVHFNNGPRVVPRSAVGGTSAGGGREAGIVGRGEHGRDLPGNSCKPNRSRLERCVVNTGHDHPGGDYPGGVDGPRGPILTHVVPTIPASVTQPAASGNGSPPPGTPGPQLARRSGSGVPPLNERRYVPDEVVVELATSVTNQQTDALARRHRLTRLRSVAFPLGGTTLVLWKIADHRTVPAVVRALETDGTVLSAQPNYLFAMQDEAAVPEVPHEGDPAQYILDKMHLPQAHALAKGKVLVAVIDSGVDVTHPDLAGDIAGNI